MKHGQPDKMALFDLDMTLIDSNYQLTHDNFSKVALRAIESGWSLGLSSDTPQLSMEFWRQQLGFNGPLIVEKGAAFVHDGVVESSIEDAKGLVIFVTI